MGIVTKINDNFQKSINACMRCTQACYECFEACLNEANVQARTKCLKSLIECARMCESSVAGMSLNSNMAKAHCELCATVCDECAKECSMFKEQHCILCAQECKACAEECRKMSKM